MLWVHIRIASMSFLNVEMNNFSCSLSCTCRTIIDCLFYASGGLYRDDSLEYIAKLLVAWL